MNKEEWIERCYLRYLARGITNKDKARLWAESLFHRKNPDLNGSPEESADKDLDWVSPEQLVNPDEITKQAMTTLSAESIASTVERWIEILRISKM